MYGPDMRGWALLMIAGCGGATTPPRDQPGPQGTWTCKQIVESCDSMCRTGMCVAACSNMGSPDGRQLHAALTQCAAANRCYDQPCTRALCGTQLDACFEGGLPPISTVPDEQPGAGPLPADAQPAPAERQAADPALSAEAIVGAWSYGSATSGGSITLSSDGRFERETHAGARQLSHAEGTWKLDGATLVLVVKGGDPGGERRNVRMASRSELAITDDAGELQSYRRNR